MKGFSPTSLYYNQGCWRLSCWKASNLDPTSSWSNESSLIECFTFYSFCQVQ